MAKPKDKYPWFKFYPQDWRGDAKLRMCSIAARGLWAEMLCVMHEAEPYGHLLVSGKPVVNRQIAALAGISTAECGKLLCELESAGVYSRTDDKVIYSRRMVRDRAKADKAQSDGLDGGNPYIRRGTVPKEDRVRPFKRSDAPQKTFRIFQKSNGKCHWCSVALIYEPDGSANSYHVDHRLPVCDGGTNDEDNLVAACADCNHKRARINNPTGSPMVRVGFNSDTKAQKPEPHSTTKATSAAAEAAGLNEMQERQALALRGMIAAIRSGKKWSIPIMDAIEDWLLAGISPNTITQACTPMLNRKEDMASLAYCDSAVRAAHAAAPMLRIASSKVWVDEGTPEWAAWQREFPGGRGSPVTDQKDADGRLTGRRGWEFVSLVPAGYDEVTSERIAPSENEDAA